MRPRAGRAFTLFIRGMFVFIGPHDPLRSTTAAESKQREPPLRLLTKELSFRYARSNELGSKSNNNVSGTL